jgi:meiotic recombination protein SPO11
LDLEEIKYPGILIPGKIPEKLSVESKNAQFILVIEKDAIFKRLTEDKIFNKIPCILITGCGFPDMGTRMILSFLYNILKIPVYCFVDFNPFGIAIYHTYKHGSINLGLETYRYGIYIDIITKKK